MVQFYFFIFVDVDNGSDGTKYVMDGYKKQCVTKAKTNPLPLLLAFQRIEVVVVLCGCFDGGKNAQILCFCNFIHLFLLKFHYTQEVVNMSTNIIGFVKAFDENDERF